MAPKPSDRLNHLDLLRMKQRGEKIACLTAYDASFSRVLDAAGVDVLLVGDSLGTVIQGHDYTISVSLNDMVYHSRCVAAGCERALLVVDLPFLSYASPEQALKSAAKLLQRGAAQMVKLEGGALRAPVVRHLVEQGVPVCGHLGLLPQSIHQLGRYRQQGKDEASAQQIFDDAVLLEQAGVSLLVLECVPAALAQSIAEQLSIPVIGIGAGAGCDGQVLVLYDILGISHGYVPAFGHNFMQGAESIQAAVQAYVSAVQNGEFPGEQ